MQKPHRLHAPTKTLTCHVEAVESLGRDVVRLFLAPPRDTPLQHQAGQYIDIVLDDGVRRSFSIANAPHRGNFIELHIRYVSGGEFSDFLFNRLKVGDALEVRGPYGQFFLREHSRRPVILLAGGTGFAPIKGIIEHLLSAGTRRPVYLYWGARTSRDLYLHQLAQSWGEEADFHYVPVCSEPTDDAHWPGRHGLVHQAVLEDFPDLSGFDVYANGPRIMITSAREAFLAHGLPEEHFFYDAA